MTFIAEGGGRTVTNCTVFDRRKVYEIVASAEIDVVYSAMNEVHKTGRTVTENIIYHIVAESEDLAMTLFRKNWGSPSRRHTLKSIKPLFVIDGEIITTGHR